VIVIGNCTDGSVLRRFRLTLLGYSTGDTADAWTPAANAVNKATAAVNYLNVS